MSKRPIDGYIALDVTNQSTNVTGKSTSCQYQDTISYIYQWSNAAGLTADIMAEELMNNQWEELNFTAPISLVGASGKIRLIFTKLTGKEIRPKVNIGAGSVDLKITVSGNSLGN